MKSIKFKLEDIKLLRSEVRDHPIVFSEEFNPEKVQIDMDSRFNYQDDFLQNFMHFKFEIGEKEKKVFLGHFDIIYTFEVENLQEILTDEETRKALHLNVISVTYSTSRGILFSETKGFALNAIYLSPISPQKLYEAILNQNAEMSEQSLLLDKK